MAKREITPEEGEHLLSAVINSMFLLENMDVLKETVHYRENIKKFGNLFINSCKVLINKNKLTQDENPRITNNLFIDNAELREKLLRNTVKDNAILNQMHDYYKDNPEEWESFYQFKELNPERDE